MIDFFEINQNMNELWGTNIMSYSEVIRYTHFYEICLCIKKNIIESIHIFKIDMRFTAYLSPFLTIYKL